MHRTLEKTLFIVTAAFLIAAPASVALAQEPPAEPPKEVTEARTQDAATFRLNSHRQTLFADDLHYQDASGDWLPVDLGLKQTAGDAPSDDPHVLTPADEYRVKASAVATTIKQRALLLVGPDGKGIEWTLLADAEVEPAAPLARDRREVSFHDSPRAITWTWSITPTGAKLLGVVGIAQGAENYTFDYRLVGTSQPLEQAPDGSLTGDGFIVRPVVIVDALGNRYSADYQLSGGSVSFTFDDSVVPPGGYPYVIDPSTDFDVDTADEDGYVERQGASYPPDGDSGQSVNLSGNDISVRKHDSGGGTFTTRTGVVAWDTSSIPDDATVTGATLTLNLTTVTDTDNRQLLIDWYTGVPPVTASDFDETGDGNAGGFPLAALSAGSASLELNTAAHTIDAEGMTSLRFTIDGGQPTGENLAEFESFDAAGTAEPRLTIEYETPLTLTEPTIGEVTAYQDILESGDFLVVAPYEITFNTLPEELASQEYISRFKDGSIILQAERPVSTSENALAGYGDGFISFYFSTNQFAQANGEWQQPGKYTVTLEAINGNQSTSTTAISYQNAGRDALLSDLRTLAQTLETRWQIDVIASNRLTRVGQDYCEAVIPLIQQMLPDFVNISVTRPEPESIAVDESATSDIAFSNFWAGTTAKDGIDGIGTSWGISGVEVATMLALVAGLVVCIWAVLAKAHPVVGVVGFGITVILSANVGLAPLALALVLGFIGLLALVYIFFIRTASA